MIAFLFGLPIALRLMRGDPAALLLVLNGRR